MNGEVTTRDDAQQVVTKPLFALLQKRKKQIEAILPSFLTPERVLNLVNLAILKTPQLIECSPHSVVNAILHASLLGLEIAPEQAYLIPYRVKGKMQALLLIDYRAKRDIVVAGGLVKNIHPYAVFAHDEFSMQLDPSLGLMQVHYKPFLARKTEAGFQPIESEEQRGVMLGVLSIAPFASGGADVLWMPKLEIDAVRKRSRAANDGPWVSDYLEMAKKTAVHRHVKSLPKPRSIAAWRAGEPLPVPAAIQRAQEIDDKFELAEPLDNLIDADLEDERPFITQGSTEDQQQVAEEKIAAMAQHMPQPDPSVVPLPTLDAQGKIRGVSPYEETAARYEQKAAADRAKAEKDAREAEAKAAKATAASPTFSFGRKK